MNDRLWDVAMIALGTVFVVNNSIQLATDSFGPLMDFFTSVLIGAWLLMIWRAFNRLRGGNDQKGD